MPELKRSLRSRRAEGRWSSCPREKRVFRELPNGPKDGEVGGGAEKRGGGRAMAVGARRARALCDLIESRAGVIEGGASEQRGHHLASGGTWHSSWRYACP